MVAVIHHAVLSVGDWKIHLHIHAAALIIELTYGDKDNVSHKATFMWYELEPILKLLQQAADAQKEK